MHSLGQASSLTVSVCSNSLAKINETDTFGPGDDEDIQFDDIGDDDEDIDDVSRGFLLLVTRKAIHR